MPSIKSKLQSILFVSNKPLQPKQLAKVLDATEAEVIQGLRELVQEHHDSGVIIIEGSDGYQMATNRENSEIVKAFLNADLRERLTDATVEVLAIIAYRQP